ncbi:MAG TPA: glycosyltransferase family 4 protein [Candidatus Limnocylindria bacterium]|nr:glycosyltransferase family 4 protein [Candidatus Limnocylindria bacterium]
MSRPSGPRVTMLVRNPFTNDTRVEREAASLARAGYQVTVVAEAAEGLPRREQTPSSTIIRVARPMRSVPGLRFVAFIIRLAMALVRTRPTILHAHDTDALQSVAPAAARLGIPFVYDAHELWLGRSRRGRSWLYDRLARLYFGAIERLAIPRAAAVIVANPAVGPELERRYGLRDVQPVPNYPVEVDPPQPLQLRDLPGGDLIPSDVPLVLYSGGIAPDRGIEQLVEAMVEIPDAHLAFMGRGGLEPAIRELVARFGLGRRVHFLGMVPSDEVVPYAASATVGVLSTVPTCLNNVLALPNKIFQYMAAGIPVVASDYPQIRDIVVGSGAGVVMDPTDPSSIAAALRQVLADRAEAQAVGQRGQAAIRDSYHWSVAERTLLDVYGKVAA